MDFYLHVRVLFGMIVGLSVAHLLKGIALIVQHPKRFRVYWVHLVWVLFLFLYLIHFWWWEFNLVKVREWTFPIYFFVAVYAILLYLQCSLFFPDQIGEYDGFKGYYYSRHQWIFAVMALLFIADIGDGLIKGREYLLRLGPAFAIRTVTYLTLSLLAMRIKRPWFHATFAVFAVLYEIAYILERYWTMG